MRLLAAADLTPALNFYTRRSTRAARPNLGKSACRRRVTPLVVATLPRPRAMGRRVVAPAWEPIPDDVHVLRRRPRRDRVVADDVEVFGRFVKRGRRRTISPPTSAEPPRPTAAPPSDVPRQLVTRDPSPRMDASETRAVSSPPAPFSSVDPVPYSALTALDEGMMRNMKANRKRARDAQTLLKRAVKLGEIKFFNRLVKDFGNDKQLGFAEEAFRRVADAGLERNVYTYTNMLNACVRVGELDRARRTWSDMLAAGVQPNEVTYTVLVKGLAQEGFLEEAANVVEEMRRAGVEPNARTFSTLLRNCVRHADQATADRCFATMREVGTKPDVASFEYLVKTRCAAMDAEGAWAARGDGTRNPSRVQKRAPASRRDEPRGGNSKGETSVRGGEAGHRTKQRVWRRVSGKEGGSVEENRTKTSRRTRGRSRSTRGAVGFGSKFLALRDGDATRQVEEVEAFLARGEARRGRGGGRPRGARECGYARSRLRTTGSEGGSGRIASRFREPFEARRRRRGKRVSRCAAGTETG